MELCGYSVISDDVGISVTQLGNMFSKYRS